MPIPKNNNISNLKSPFMESFRSLRTSLKFASADRDIKTIIVTSALPSEGKTTIAVNLSYSIAFTGSKVLLVDIDLRNPSIYKSFKLSKAPGLTNYLVGESDKKSYIYYIYEEVNYNNLQVIPSGTIPPNPAELIESQKMKDFLSEVKKDYDYVILDAPPILSASEAVSASAFADGVIFVARFGKTPIDAAEKAKELLTHAKANVLGVVLNGVKEKNYSYYRYYKYYNYHY
jgi:capsular exopolysaccharide synthesis family protein